MTTTVTLRRTTIDEIEIRTDDDPGPRPIRDDVVIEVTRAVRTLSRRGPQPSRRIGRVAAPLMIADGRSGR